MSPDLKTENQINHICIAKRFSSEDQVTAQRYVVRGVDVASDYHLVAAKLAGPCKGCEHNCVNLNTAVEVSSGQGNLERHY